MSLFSKMFGGGKKNEKAPTPQEAIQKLRETEEMLMKRSDFLEKKVDSELTTAKKNGTKNKRVAIAALKRKKRFEKQLGQIDGTLSTIEYQREALENARTNTEVLKVMGQAAKALKAAHSDLDIDKVHDVMDDISEQHDLAQQISDAISNPVGFEQDVDEDDLLQELENLEQKDLDEQLLDVNGPTTDTLPSVPADSLPARPAQPVAASPDDDEMSQLAAWAN